MLALTDSLKTFQGVICRGVCYTLRGVLTRCPFGAQTSNGAILIIAVKEDSDAILVQIFNQQVVEDALFTAGQGYNEGHDQDAVSGQRHTQNLVWRPRPPD